MPDKVKNETPLFYALSKHKSQADRLALATLYLKNSSSLDLNHLNSERKTVYEAYATDDIE